MTTAFLFCFTAYLAYALWENLVRRAPEAKRLSTLSAIFQAPLFATGLYLTATSGAVNRELVFLPMLALAVLAGHLVFLGSLLATRAGLRDAWGHFLDVRGACRYLANDPMTLFRVFGVSLSEEIIYRAAAQPVLTQLTGSALLGLGLTAAAFCVVHAHYFQNPWLQSAEFTAFALLLGALYLATGNLMAVTLVHAVRNWEIAYIEHLIGEHGAAESTHTPLPATTGSA